MTAKTAATTARSRRASSASSRSDSQEPRLEPLSAADRRMQHSNGQAGDGMREVGASGGSQVDAAREDVLHRAVLAGDEGAWRMLYDLAYDGVWRYVHWRTGGLREHTDEVVQDTWLVAVRRIDSFDPNRGPFLHWVRGIAANVLRNHVRRERLRQATVQSIVSEPSVNGVRAAADQRERALGIAAALSVLPEHYEAALIAKYVDGRTVAEIAAIKGDSEKAVESLLTRAREAFRRAYDTNE